jgi:hypothetical protein
LISHAAARETGHCHCADRRAHSGAPVAAFSLWRAGDVRATKGRSTSAGSTSAASASGSSAPAAAPACWSGIRARLHRHSRRRLSTLDSRPIVHLNYASTVLPMKDGLPS